MVRQTDESMSTFQTYAQRRGQLNYVEVHQGNDLILQFDQKRQQLERT